MIYGAKIGGLCPPRSLVSTSDPIGSENVRQFPIGSAVDSTKKNFRGYKKVRCVHSRTWRIQLDPRQTGGQSTVDGKKSPPVSAADNVRQCPPKTMSAQTKSNNVRQRHCPPKTMSATDNVPPRTKSAGNVSV